MTRTLLVVLLVAALTVTGVLVAGTVSRDVRYRRLVAQGDAALSLDQSFQAIEAFSGAIALRPGAMLAYLKRGETYVRRGDPGAATRDLREASRLDPSATRPLELLGDANAAQDRLVRASESYTRYLEIDERAPGILYKLGLVQFRANHVAPAVSTLRRAVALEPRFAEAYYLLGICLTAEGQFAEAEAALRRAVELSPQLVPAHEAMAAVYRRTGRERDALNQAEALAALEPASVDRQVALGLAYAGAGMRDQAVVSLRRTAQQFPDRSAVFVALGRVWMDEAEARGDRVAVSKALEALGRVATTGAATSEALTLFGRGLQLSGNLAGSERALQQATARFPVDPRAFLLLSSVAERLGHVSGARDAMATYLALTGEAADRPASLVRLAELSLRLEDQVGASGWMRQAIAAAGDDVGVLTRAAEVAMRVGDATTARSTVARGLGLAPGNPRLRALRRRLDRR